MSRARARIAGRVLAAVLVVVVGTALLLMGSPTGERLRQFDARRVDDVAVLTRAIDVYWTRNGRLPETVGALRQEQGVVPGSDPETGEPYEYRRLGPGDFEICATFDAESREPEVGFEAGVWSHGAGRQCFRRAARAVD